MTIANGGAFAGVIANGTGIGSMNFNGGTLTLSGSNTFSGATNVSTATLIVTGSLANGSINLTNSILAGAGNGTTTGLVGKVTLNSGGIHPGASAADGSVGTLTIGNLTVNGGDMRFDVANSANDEIVVTSSAAYAGSSTITIHPVNPPLTTGEYVLEQDANGLGFGTSTSFGPRWRRRFPTAMTLSLDFSNPDEIQLDVASARRPTSSGTAW